MLAVSRMALAAQYPKGAARCVVLDATPPGAPQRELLRHAIEAVPHEVIQVHNATLEKAMSALSEDLKRRAGESKVETRGSRGDDAKGSPLADGPDGAGVET